MGALTVKRLIGGYKPIVLAGILSPVLADDSNYSLFLSVLLLLQRRPVLTVLFHAPTSGDKVRTAIPHPNAYYSPTDDG